jgi:chitinase
MIKLASLMASAFFAVAAIAQLPSPALVGYWHNWNDVNAKYIDIDSVDSRYNVIPVAFAIPTSNTDMTMTFTPDRGTVQQLKDRIKRQQDKGKKVLLSIGGATAYVDLTTAANQDAFTTSLVDILETYGFDGLDIDIEHGRSILIEGGTIAAPQNPAQNNLIAAIKTIMAEYRATFGRKMLLTFAPETAYVQGGMSGFGNIWGGYLPILDAFRDSLDLIHVQLYNSGTMYGIDNKIYAQGTADFIVAMTEAVIKGFATRGGGTMGGFPASKVAVGLPATVNAAGGGYVDSATIDSAVTYLLGKGPRPGTYVLNKATGYPDLGGMMTWSINWDSVSANGKRYPYASVYHALFGTPPLPVPDQVQLIAPFHDQYLRQNSVQLRWARTEPEVTSYHVEVRQDGRIVTSDTAITDTTQTMATLIPATTYTWRVRARNASGWGSWSTQRTFRSVPFPTRPQLIAPAPNRTLTANTTTLQWGKASPDVLDYRVTLTLKSGSVVADSIVTDTTLFVWLMPATTYMWRVQARNVSGAGEWSDTWSFTSLPYPDTVQLLLPANQSVLIDSAISMTWMQAGPGVQVYHLELYRGGSLITSDSSLTDTVMAPTDPRCCVTYAWRVRARNASGWGPWSATRQFEFLPPPSAVSIVGPAQGAQIIEGPVTIMWLQASPKVLAYHIQVRQDTTIVYSSETLTDTSLALPALPIADGYSVRVRAANASGIGPWTDWRMFAIIADTTTSVEVSMDGDALQMYPHPVGHVLTIQSTTNIASDIVIYDLHGRQLHASQADQPTSTRMIDLSALQPGIYVLRAGRIVQTIVKQ